MTPDDTALLDTLDRLNQKLIEARTLENSNWAEGEDVAAHDAYLARCNAEDDLWAFLMPDRITRLVALARQGAEVQTALRRVGIGRSDECGDSGAMVEWFATTEQGEQGCGTLDAALQRLTDAAMEDARREVSERFRTTLSEHWLTEIQCHHESRTDTAHCYCTVWASGALPNVGAAVDAWVTHVMDAARTALPLPDGGPTNGR